MITILLYMIIPVAVAFIINKIIEKRRSAADIPFDYEVAQDDTPDFNCLDIELVNVTDRNDVFKSLKENQLLKIRMEKSSTAARAGVYTLEELFVGHLPSDEKIMKSLTASKRSLAAIKGKSHNSFERSVSVDLYLNMSEDKFSELALKAEKRS